MSISGGPDIVENGLVLHLDAADLNSYPGSGTLWTDLSGNGNNGTLTNGPTFSSSNRGSIVFDGTDDYVTTPSGQTFYQYATDITACIWFKKNGNLIQGTPCGQSTLNVDNWTTSNVWLIHSNMSDNTITFFVNNGSYYRDKTSHALTDNIWYFVCGTCNSSSIRIYINGVQSGSTGTGINTGTILNNSNSVIQYGKDPRYGLGSGRFFNSLIGICYVYNRALSASEILQNYNATKGRYGL